MVKYSLELRHVYIKKKKNMVNELKLVERRKIKF